MMPMPLIRPSRPDDIPAITGIYGHAVATGLASFELDPPDREEMARRREALVAAGLPHLVAERGGTVVGFAYAGRYHARPGYRFTVEDTVYVAPGESGRGHGRALLTRVIADCERLGFRRMIAVIGDSGNAASIRLHAALGFTHAGLLPSVGWKHGRWLDSVLMQRALGVGNSTPPDRAS